MTNIYEWLIPIALLRKSGNDGDLYCFQLLAMTQAQRLFYNIEIATSLAAPRNDKYINSLGVYYF